MHANNFFFFNISSITCLKSHALLCMIFCWTNDTWNIDYFPQQSMMWRRITCGEKRTGSHHENHSTPPRIMYAVKLDVPSLFQKESSLDSVFLSLVLNSADYLAYNLHTCKKRTIL